MSDNTLKTTTLSIRIFEAITRGDATTISGLATEFDLAKGTIQAHVNTLLDCQYIKKTPDGYRSGLKSFRIGCDIATAREEYYITREQVKSIAKMTGERIQYVVEDFGFLIVLCTDSGANAIRTDVHIGAHTYLHWSAAGKSILAHLPELRVDEILDDRGLPERTEHTITDSDKLREELETIRSRGYALNREERIPRQKAVGVPVFDDEDEVIGGLSIGGPAHRMSDERIQTEFIDELQGAADAIHLELSYGE